MSSEAPPPSLTRVVRRVRADLLIPERIAARAVRDRARVADEAAPVLGTVVTQSPQVFLSLRSLKAVATIAPDK